MCSEIAQRKVAGTAEETRRSAGFFNMREVAWGRCQIPVASGTEIFDS
jgi:hypothetical protein